MPSILRGRIALITGVSRARGIGAAVALALAEAGADICTSYYRPFDRLMPWGSQDDEAELMLDVLCEKGVRATGVELDLADPTAPARLFNFAERELGPVDILVNNAAFDQPCDLLMLTAEHLDAHYAVNVRGAGLLCAEFARRHDGRPGGRIINLTSGQSLGGMPDNLPYAVTKGAVEALTLSISPTLARKGITVNAVDPGPTDTGWMSAALHAELTARAPFGRVGLPQDAASLITFLASDEAAWLTGQVIHSRGGL